MPFKPLYLNPVELLQVVTQHLLLGVLLGKSHTCGEFSSLGVGLSVVTCTQQNS